MPAIDTALSSDVQREILPNGLTVLLKEVYPAQVVSVGLWAKVGSADEPEAVAGVSHFLEHMVFKGTPTRPVGTISQEVHGLGGYMNAFTSYDCTCYWMVVPSAHLDTALDIQADALLHSLFDPGEVARESHVILEELRMYEDRPGSFCHQKLMGLLFSGHPYGRPIIGHADIIAGLSRAGLVDWYRQHYQPANLTLVLVGALDPDRTLERVSVLMGRMAPLPVARQSPAPLPPFQATRLDLQGPIHSAHWRMGFRLPCITSDEAYACDLLCSMLGGGRSSRLYQALRERRGLVAQVGSSVSFERGAGALHIEALHGPGRADEVGDAIRQEIDRLQQARVPSDELQKAKNMVEAAYVFAQETVEGQGRKLGYDEMVDDYRLTERYIERLYQVTADEVLERARHYLAVDQAAVVTYGPC
ncbi:MAG TPA: pitrilysin family protein [Candidatus Xenobia bacterium]|jgi:zinc protease